MIDVDNFKQINDSYGHVAGDAALCTIVRTIFEHVRADDVVLRYGGDEFLLMFEEIPGKGISAEAGRYPGRNRNGRCAGIQRNPAFHERGRRIWKL